MHSLFFLLAAAIGISMAEDFPWRQSHCDEPTALYDALPFSYPPPHAGDWLAVKPVFSTYVPFVISKAYGGIVPKHLRTSSQASFETYNFRALFAGVGSGESLIAFALQLHQWRLTEYEITAVDASTTSLKTTELRLKDVLDSKQISLRGEIKFVRANLLDIPTWPDLQPFHYIDCQGVIHHLPSPEMGLNALASVLHEDGVLNLMVYGKIKRRIIYPLQQLFRALQLDFRTESIAMDIFQSLPQTGRMFRQLLEFTDHKVQGAFSDLLLHNCDTAFTIGEIYQMAQRLDLSAVPMFPGLYEIPTTLMEKLRSHPAVSSTFQSLTHPEKLEVGELLAGNIGTHNLMLRKKSIPKTKRMDVTNNDYVQFLPTPSTNVQVPVPREPYILDAAMQARRPTKVQDLYSKFRDRVNYSMFLADLNELVELSQTVPWMEVLVWSM